MNEALTATPGISIDDLGAEKPAEPSSDFDGMATAIVSLSSDEIASLFNPKNGPNHVVVVKNEDNGNIQPGSTFRRRKFHRNNNTVEAGVRAAADKDHQESFPGREQNYRGDIYRDVVDVYRKIIDRLSGGNQQVAQLLAEALGNYPRLLRFLDSKKVDSSIMLKMAKLVDFNPKELFRIVLAEEIECSYDYHRPVKVKLSPRATRRMELSLKRKKENEKRQRLNNEIADRQRQRKIGPDTSQRI